MIELPTSGFPKNQQQRSMLTEVLSFTESTYLSVIFETVSAVTWENKLFSKLKK